MLLIGQTNAQYLIAGYPPDSGGYIIPFQDTLLSSTNSWGNCTASHYYFDLDQDSIMDVDFYLDCYLGGYGGSWEMSVTCFNDFSVHVDPSYEEHVQFIDSTGQVQDITRITPVVKKYNLGDTIFNNQTVLATNKRLLYTVHGEYPPCVYNNINLFLGDTSYIAFEKSNSDLYYFKIYVPNKYNLKLIYERSNTPYLSINNIQLQENYIFPNPAKEIINFKKTFDLIEIYTLQGTLLIEKYLTDNQKTLDISFLKSGLYIVILKKGSAGYITKLIKL